MGLARSAASSTERTSSTVHFLPAVASFALPAFSAAANVALARFFPVSAGSFAVSFLGRPRVRFFVSATISSSAATTSASATGATFSVPPDAHEEVSMKAATTRARRSTVSSSKPQKSTSFIDSSARSNSAGSGVTCGLGKPWWILDGTLQHSTWENRA